MTQKMHGNISAHSEKIYELHEINDIYDTYQIRDINIAQKIFENISVPE